jgi:hypothetical protein
MPARKPISLHTGRRDTPYIQARVRAEAAFTPQKALPMAPPEEISSDPVAAAIWKRLIKLYRGLEYNFVSLLDKNIILEYCRAISELEMLRKLRAQAIKQNNLEAVLKLDARADRKAIRLDNLGDRLYLSPRARSGVVPENKSPEPMEPPFQEGSILWEDFVKKGNEKDE